MQIWHHGGTIGGWKYDWGGYHKEYKECHIFILVDPYNFKLKH
jgi:hypothetical protein